MTLSWSKLFCVRFYSGLFISLIKQTLLGLMCFIFLCLSNQKLGKKSSNDSKKGKILHKSFISYCDTKKSYFLCLLMKQDSFFAKLHKWWRNDISPSLNIWVILFLCNEDYTRKFNVIFAELPGILRWQQKMVCDTLFMHFNLNTTRG